MLRKLIKQIFSYTKDEFGRRIIIFMGMKFVLNHKEFEIQQLHTFLELSTDITKLPKATGVLRLIQEADTILLKNITDLCEKNGLTYWINYGTLLGAVRHKGFIPWDDDLDICMPRDDYEKLISIIENLFCGTEYLYTLTDCLRIFYKNTPIQLDIFPLDYYYKNVESKEEENELFKKVSRAKKHIKYYNNKAGLNGINIKNSYNEIIRLRDEIVMEYNPADKNASLFRAIETYVWHLSYYKRDWIFPLQKIEFEGNMYNAPNKISTVLYENYGDYMQYPKTLTNRHRNIKKKINPQTIALMEDYIRNYKEVKK